MSSLKIDIALPADRHREGSLTLTDGTPAAVLGAWPCLGRAAQELASAAGNPTRNPLQHDGDTPLGRYAAAAVTPADLPGIGKRWIKLTPIAGDAWTAWINGRHGLGIHGGRGDDRLVPTAGCVRLRDSAFAELEAALAGRPAAIEIREQG